MRRLIGRRVGALALVILTLGGLSACSSTSDAWTEDRYVIAAGGANGVYDAYGTAFADELSRRTGIPVAAEETAGSVDNLVRVSTGEALLGFAQGDAAADAVEGAGAFTSPLAVQAVARLYDEYLHVVVRADSDIDDVSDLAGRHVSLGAENSGVHVIAERVLEAAGVDVDTIDDASLDLRESIDAMAESEIDGFFWVGGIPTPGITELAAATPVRLLPIEQSWVNRVNERYSHAYRPSDFPIGLYGIEESEPTLAVPNYLMTAAGTPDGVVRDVLSTLFDSRTRLAQRVPTAALLDRRQAIFTGPVPLHPGAVEYYRDERE